MPKVVKVQSGYKVQPLSAYLGKPAPPPAPAVEFPRIDDKLAKTRFWDYLAFSLPFAPAGPEETEIRARLEKLGAAMKSASPETKAAVEQGMKAGEQKIQEYLAKQQKVVNGWKMSDLFGDRDFFAGDWLKRSAGAVGGIYGNEAIEATYLSTKTLAGGEELDGSQHDYSLTFAAGQLPPVNAFWSITMYDGKTQLLIENPIHRYLINSPMLPSMKKNADGSLTIYIQKDSPGKARESNWLPAPNGPIYLVMRLYWPRAEPPSVLPPGDGTWKPPAIVAASEKTS
jgi:hypothetical protein